MMARRIPAFLRKGQINRALVNALAPARLEFAATHGLTDDTYFKMFAMSDYASEQPLGWGDGFIGSSLKAPVVIRCVPASKAAMQELVDKTASEADAQIVSVRKSLSETIDDKQAEEHAVRIARMIARDNVRMFEAVIYIALRERELEDITDSEDYLRRMLAPYGNGVKTLVANQDKMFFAASPMLAEDEVTFEQTARPTPASTLAWMMPFRSTGLADPRGIAIGVDDDGGAVRLDTMTHTSTRKNSNGIFVGDSGSGKSAELKHIALHEWAVKGAKILWIDPEGEAEDLVSSLGCKVVRIGSESESGIPVFAPRNIGTSDDSGDDEGESDSTASFRAASQERVLAATIPFVTSYIKIAFSPEREDIPALEEALEAAYARFGIGSLMTFAEYDSSDLSYPVMCDLYDVLNELADKHPESPSYARLAKCIRKAAVGYDAHRYNSRETIDASGDIVLINTEGISADEDMMRAEYYNILSWCWSQIRSERFTGRYVRLIADELHTVVNRKSVDAAMMVKNIVQRARKYGAGFFGSTPQIVDFRAEGVKDIGEAIILNSTYRFYGGARGDNLESVVKTEGFSPEVEQGLMRAQRARFVVCAGPTDKTWVNTVIPDWELALFGSGGGK